MHQLSYRQITRLHRSPSCSSLPSTNSDVGYEECTSTLPASVPLSAESAPARASAAASAPVTPIPYFQMQRFWNSTGNLLGLLSNECDTDKSSPSFQAAATNLKKENCAAPVTAQAAVRRRVTFKASVKVIYIPCREEYKAVRLLEQMWYFGDDFEYFKREAISELRVVMIRSKLSVKEASAELYGGAERDEKRSACIAQMCLDDDDKENKENVCNVAAIDTNFALMMDATTAAAISSPSRKVVLTPHSGSAVSSNTSVENVEKMHFPGPGISGILETEDDCCDMQTMHKMQGESRSLLLGF